MARMWFWMEANLSLIFGSLISCVNGIRSFASLRAFFLESEMEVLDTANISWFNVPWRKVMTNLEAY